MAAAKAVTALVAFTGAIEGSALELTFEKDEAPGIGLDSGAAHRVF